MESPSTPSPSLCHLSPTPPPDTAWNISPTAKERDEAEEWEELEQGEWGQCIEPTGTPQGWAQPMLSRKEHIQHAGGGSSRAAGALSGHEALEGQDTELA